MDSTVIVTQKLSLRGIVTWQILKASFLGYFDFGAINNQLFTAINVMNVNFIMK